MHTIKTYDTDDSALGRLSAWSLAFEIAKSRLTGGGFFTWNTEIYQIFLHDTSRVYGPHSVYFQMMGEHGFVGLALYLTMWIMVFLKFGRIRKVARQRPETQWLAALGDMGQASVLGFAVGGAFLGLANWDLPYNILILAVLGWRWIEEEKWKTDKPEPTFVWPWTKRRVPQTAMPRVSP